MKDKAVLHDHLDGGLRPSTILDLAQQLNIKLPTTDKQLLADWFFENISSEQNQVFNKFELTISIMQDEESIERVAYEAVEDLTIDGISQGDFWTNLRKFECVSFANPNKSRTITSWSKENTYTCNFS